MQFLDQERWRSFGAGMAISYVFLDILPHLASQQYVLREPVGTGLLSFLEHHAYLLALVGFILYFGLADVVKTFRIQQGVKSAHGNPHSALYILVLAFAVYGFLIGYLIGEQPDHRYEPVIIFAFAMSIHMAGIDHTLRDYHPKFYDRIFCHLLAVATFMGWLLGTMTVVPDIIFALVFSFVVGAIIVVAFFYELPVVSGSMKYWMFVLGVIGFSVLLLIYLTLARAPLQALST
jgi:hypothetical protein